MKPRRKGDPVQFRLPIELHELLVELAAPADPSAYVAALMTDRLTEVRKQRLAQLAGD
jgi:hypothetical protein